METGTSTCCRAIVAVALLVHVPQCEGGLVRGLLGEKDGANRVQRLVQSHAPGHLDTIDGDQAHASSEQRPKCLGLHLTVHWRIKRGRQFLRQLRGAVRLQVDLVRLVLVLGSW